MKILVPAMLILLMSSSVLANPNSVDSNGKGLKGYDPVAYLDKGQVGLGQDGIHFTFRGARYHFLDMPNKVSFVKNKEHYLPQFGGFCAASVLSGQKVSSQPEYFLVFEEKLYMFENELKLNAWKAQTGDKIIQANNRWQQIVSREQKTEE